MGHRATLTVQQLLPADACRAGRAMHVHPYDTDPLL